MWTSLRTIVEEKSVSDSAEQLAKAFPRFDDAWEGLKWLVCRTPDLQGASHKQVSDRTYFLYTAAGDPLAGTPDISIVYTFDLDAVVVYGLRATEQEHDAFD